MSTIRFTRLHALLWAALLTLPTGAALAAEAPAQPAATAQPGAKPPAPPAWVQRSNANAFIVLGVIARFSPEMAVQEEFVPGQGGAAAAVRQAPAN